MCVLLAVAALLPGPAQAQVADVELRSTVFHEPSRTSKMTVFSPEARVAATPVGGLRLGAGYVADIVSGASESVKAGPLSGPDIVSAASVVDLRHVANGSVALVRGTTEVSVGYSYGIENDYRSHAVTVGAATELFERNTRLEVGYGRGFDEVCDLARNGQLDPTVRLGLDSSTGCFTAAADRSTRDVSLDNFQLGWTQSLTPVLTTQLVLTGALQTGFLSNPYRSVVVGTGGEQAQEHHPEHRARGAISSRTKLFVKWLQTAFTLGLRAYRDSWELVSGTIELSGERYLTSWLRLELRGRFYDQSGTSFWSDDYTGGEPLNGPRGSYFTGDRELSPLRGYQVGVRVLSTWRGERGRLGPFERLTASFGMDLSKTQLLEFTWGGRTPDDTLALLPTLAATATF